MEHRGFVSVKQKVRLLVTVGAPEVYVWWEERTRVRAGVPQAVCCEYDCTCDCFAVAGEEGVFGYNLGPIPFSSQQCFFTMWLLQTAEQTNKHMGTQTPCYHHVADAAWFGLYFSCCHSNGKPGSKSEYPLWCSTPPYGKILVTAPKAWFVSPTSHSQLQFSRGPPETCHMPVRAPRRSQASSIGNEGTSSSL